MFDAGAEGHECSAVQRPAARGALGRSTPSEEPRRRARVPSGGAAVPGVRERCFQSTGLAVTPHTCARDDACVCVRSSPPSFAASTYTQMTSSPRLHPARGTMVRPSPSAFCFLTRHNVTRYNITLCTYIRDTRKAPRPQRARRTLSRQWPQSTDLRRPHERTRTFEHEGQRRPQEMSVEIELGG